MLLELTDRECERLKNELNRLPRTATDVHLVKEATSEFGMSVFLKYRSSEYKVIDLTEMDNF